MGAKREVQKEMQTEAGEEDVQSERGKGDVQNEDGGEKRVQNTQSVGIFQYKIPSQ